jgi:hypothetical protein
MDISDISMIVMRVPIINAVDDCWNGVKVRIVFAAFELGNSKIVNMKDM